MRHTRIAIILAVFILTAGAGCSSYDRELLGDPEPEQVRETELVANEIPPGDFERATEDYDVGMFDELKFYGTWHWVEPYGWTWRPLVTSLWHPFLYGHWIWSEYGWMWVSYDTWGWATTHYGFWATDFIYGWIWIPGYEWYPSRCEWMAWDDYICWAPVAPEGVRFKDPWESDAYPWVAVPAGKFKETEVGKHRTTPKFKTGYSEKTLRRTAPELHDIERIGGKPIGMVDVNLDRQVVGEREFARIVLPADQQRIVNKQQSKMKSTQYTRPTAGQIRSGKPSSPTYGPNPPATNPTTGNDGGDTRTKEKAKSEPKTEPKKNSGGKKDGDKPQDYKEKRKEESKSREPKNKG